MSRDRDDVDSRDEAAEIVHQVLEMFEITIDEDTEDTPLCVLGVDEETQAEMEIYFSELLDAPSKEAKTVIGRTDSRWSAQELIAFLIPAPAIWAFTILRNFAFHFISNRLMK